MSKFYEIQPLDTLFFRGSTPMEAGMMNTVSMFPPPESVIRGAFWTTYCNQKNKKYTEGLTTDDLTNEKKIPFEVEGFFIKKDDRIYLPCPATWYYDSSEKITTGSNLKDTPLIVAKNISEDIKEKLKMKSSAGDVVFVNPKNDAKSLLGSWVLLDFFKNPKDKFSEKDILFVKDIYATESRTGVALDSNKKAKDGQLYSSSHIRMNDDITFVIQLDDNIEIEENGNVFLGGEKRLSKYSLIKNLDLEFNNVGEQYLSLMPIEATKENLDMFVSSNKLIVTAGWDLAKGFHKPTTNWIPAGAVLTKKINNSCVALTQTK